MSRLVAFLFLYILFILFSVMNEINKNINGVSLIDYENAENKQNLDFKKGSDLRRIFGKNIKILRQAAGLSQEELAFRCHFARSYFSRIERGQSNPSLDAIEVLANNLGVAVWRLFEPINNEKICTSDGKLLVPFAADNSYFNPTLKRPKSRMFAVGERVDTKYFADFGQALDFLRNMKTAKWWRPNAKGAWGLVSAVRWSPLPECENLPELEIKK